MKQVNAPTGNFSKRSLKTAFKILRESTKQLAVYSADRIVDIFTVIPNFGNATSRMHRNAHGRDFEISDSLAKGRI
jgi:hypothetical protein